MNTSKLILGLLSGAVLWNTVGVLSVTANEANLVEESLCRKFPLNSQCQHQQLKASVVQTHQLDRQSFCARFPFNFQCQQLEILKLALKRSGEQDEWIQIEKRKDRVKIRHTTKVKDGLASALLNGSLGLIPVPVPLPELNKYSWKDHQTIAVSFQSDACKSKNCIISGKADTLIMPNPLDLHSGIFTLSYQEENLKRSVSFRIPPEVNAETPDTVTVKFSN